MLNRDAPFSEQATYYPNAPSKHQVTVQKEGGGGGGGEEEKEGRRSSRLSRTSQDSKQGEGGEEEDNNEEEEGGRRSSQASRTSQEGKEDENQEEATANHRVLYGLNLVHTKYDDSVKRGAIAKAICVFSRFHFIDAFRKPLMACLEDYFANPQEEVVADFFTWMRSLDITKVLPRPTLVETKLMQRSVTYKPLGYVATNHTPLSWYFGYECVRNEQAFTLCFPLYKTPDELFEAPIARFISLFKEDTMKIYNALLKKQRILFVGYNHSAYDVVSMVLACVSLVSPPIPNILRRTFPYATLSDLDFLQVDGYIAGVTNPMFASHDSWWDLLCTLDLPNDEAICQTQEEKRSEDEKKASQGSGPPPPPGPSAPQDGDEMDSTKPSYYAEDLRFIKGVLSGLHLHLGETWFRMKFREYTESLVLYAQMINEYFDHWLDTSLLQEQFVASFEANRSRVETMLSGIFQEEGSLPAFNPWLEEKERGSSLRRHLITLQFSQLLSYAKIESIFANFEILLQSETSLKTLLSLLPESKYGIFALASSLFHSSPSVRFNGVNILLRLNAYESTRCAIEGLNPMLDLQFRKQVHDLESGTLEQLIKEASEGNVWANRSSITNQDSASDIFMKLQSVKDESDESGDEKLMTESEYEDTETGTEFTEETEEY